MDIPDKDTSHLPGILVICGPTAVGKSSFALTLAKRMGGEIVNADSVQVFEHVDIGTSKPSRAVRESVPHHLFDIYELDEESNVAEYIEMAKEAIGEIHDRGHIPIVVGGTGLYIRMLVHGIFDVPEADDEIREKYWDIEDEKGSHHLHDQLQEVDPDLADDVHPNDAVRIIRGLEVYEQTGKPLSLHKREHKFSDPNFDALKIGLIRPREELYDRINERAELMVEKGLIEEYRDIIEQGYSQSLKPLNSLGYSQMREHVFGDLSLEEAIEQMQSETRRYAKQQISWFRSEPNVHWAMAPVVGEDGLPGEVVADVEAFFENEEPDLDWADVEPYDVSRD